MPMTKADVDLARRDLLVRQQAALEARFEQSKADNQGKTPRQLLEDIQLQDSCLNEIVGMINTIAQLDAKMALSAEEQAALDKHSTPMVAR